jgi:prevent-host-death family protein
MNAVWQVQEAKNRFSEVIEMALTEGPQVVTRHGRAVVRIVSVAEVDAESAAHDDGFASYLLASPRVDGLTAPVRRSRKTPPVLGG